MSASCLCTCDVLPLLCPHVCAPVLQEPQSGGAAGPAHDRGH